MKKVIVLFAFSSLLLVAQAQNDSIRSESLPEDVATLLAKNIKKIEYSIQIA